MSIMIVKNQRNTNQGYYTIDNQYFIKKRYPLIFGINVAVKVGYKNEKERRKSKTTFF